MANDQTPANDDTVTEETVTDNTVTDTVEDTASGLEDAIHKAKDQLLGLLEQGQAGASKGYGLVVDRIEKFEVTELPGYDRLSKIDTPEALNREALNGYVDQANKVIKERRDAVSKAIADRRS